MKFYLATFLLLIFLFWGIVFLWNDYYSKIHAQKMYDTWDYEKALTTFQHVKKSPENLHNLWNSLFKKFINQEEIDSLDELEAAVHSYSGSLVMEENEDTRFNYEYTKNILDTLKQQEEEKQQEQEQKQKEQDSWDENQNGQEEEQKDWNGWEESSQSWESGENPWDKQSWESQNNGNEAIQNSRPEEYQLWQDDTISQLSQQEKEALDQAVRDLKQDQVSNQRYFDKQTQASDFERAFDAFIGRQWEKDW